MMTEHNDLSALRQLIASKRATIGVLGVGYVGLPLACAFAEAGIMTIAGDTNQEKVRQIRQGSSYVEDPYVNKVLRGLISSGKLEATVELNSLASRSDIAIITVPTPLSEKNEPDLSHVTRATEIIAEELRPGKLVILESSVYPGVTDEILKPILERKGLKVGREFGLAHSPERIDYGNSLTFQDIPKVVGGVTHLCTELASELYSKILRVRVVPVKDARTAEMVKMVENTYRYVNIALVNELAVVCEKLGVDIFEVVAAAATKPFGFQAHYPGPGVGGHCIPKDPHYLSFKARQAGARLEMVELSTSINDRMSAHITELLMEHYRLRGKKLQGLRAVLLGLAFKANISDTRRSPSIALAEHLADQGAEVVAFDPFGKSVETRNGILSSSENLDIAVKNADLLVLVTPHACFKDVDLNKLIRLMHHDATICDTRGFWSRNRCERAGFSYLCLGGS
jgi:UDP-N-acetyl-D-glucosamine dehydrogenase